MAQANLPKQILVIDDDSTVGQALEGPLSTYKVRVVNAQNLETAMHHFDHQIFDVVFVELEFQPLYGLSLIQKWRAHPDIERRCSAFVLMSGKAKEPKGDMLARELGDVEYIIKPFNSIKVLPYLSRGVDTKRKRFAFEQFRFQIFQKYEETEQLEPLAQLLRSKLATLGVRGVMLLVELYEKAGKYEDALNFITKIMERDPGNVACLYTRGRLLLRMTRYDEALTFLEKASASAPLNLERLQDMAEVYMQLKDPDQSVVSMRSLVDHSPEKPDLKYEMSQKLREHGFEQHAANFSRENSSPMDVIRYYNNRAIALTKLGDHEGAVQEYQQALTVFPESRENFRLHYNLALAMIKIRTLDNYQKALSHLQKCLEMKPDFDKAKSTLEIIEKTLAAQKAS